MLVEEYSRDEFLAEEAHTHSHRNPHRVEVGNQIVIASADCQGVEGYELARVLSLAGTQGHRGVGERLCLLGIKFIADTSFASELLRLFFRAALRSNQIVFKVFSVCRNACHHKLEEHPRIISCLVLKD